MSGEVTRHLARLMDRVAYLDRLNEQHGTNIGRTHEYNAMTWAIEELSAVYPAEFEEAERLAEQIRRRRSERADQSQV